ncbi:unnamed protein product [Owenia fusiformis]|uniref:Eukaryotic translation initiation factor 5A n=1 Tax=Owenia fusiformis TaxID=6347 RepID=A0A8J1TA80_OWEFU|nr:unnamed protein product [Owenia fusiformis]
MTEESFASSGAGAASCYPVQCSTLRKGGHVMIKGHPCKIVNLSSASPGKHGHAKIQLVGLDIFTGSRYEDSCPSKHTMSVPEVNKNEIHVLSVAHDGYISLLLENGEIRRDLKVPDNGLGKEIHDRIKQEEDIAVCILSACEQEAIIGVKKLHFDP